MPRRFPAPWKVIERPECFIVEDATGKRLAYFYYVPEHQLSSDPHALLKEEAREMAEGFVRMGEGR